MTAPSGITWRLSQSLSRAKLLQLAVAVGAPLSGTKPQILSNVRNVVAKTDKLLSINNGYKALKKSSNAIRVLSIDLGVRNLAYALLEHQLPQSESHLPLLLKWRRLSLDDSELSVPMPQESEAQSSDFEEATTVTTESIKESFEPADLAPHACRLSRQFANFEPTHILIERQRFRSASQAAVQEWSLRVGMLEAMLYAAFRILVEEKLLTAEVESVLPARVNKYWFESQDNGIDDVVVVAETNSKVPTAKKAKAAKIAMVTKMLQNLQTQTAIFTLHPELNNLSKAFLPTKTPRRSSEKVLHSSRPLTKLDDLSDCLLQGLAWLRWQENRLRIVEN